MIPDFCENCDYRQLNPMQQMQPMMYGGYPGQMMPGMQMAPGTQMTPGTQMMPGMQMAPGTQMIPGTQMMPGTQMTPETQMMPEMQGGLGGAMPGQQTIPFMQQYLRTQIGRHVKIDFLIGTSGLTDREGTLLEVGISYVVIREAETDDLIMGDIFSIKFVRFYY